MNITTKKDLKNLFFLIPLLIISLILLILDIYVYVVQKNNLNLYLLIPLSLFFFIIFILFLKLIISPKYPLNLYDDYLIIKKTNKEIKINYDEVFYFSSSYQNESSFFNGGTINIYLKNGERIKIKNIKHVIQIRDILNLKINKDEYSFTKENKFLRFIGRIYQYILTFFSKFIKFKSPVVLSSLDELKNCYKKDDKVFILSSSSLVKNNSISKITDVLSKNNINFYVYEPKVSNPTKEDVLKGKEIYLENSCTSLLALGGGSVIDLAKAIGVSLTNKKEIEKYSGLFKVRHNIPLLIAIPSTSGSGSETTLASVITSNGRKCAIESNKITPSFTYLKGDFIESLPNKTLIETTCDALTHALESYLNVPNFKKHDDEALKAMELIFSNLDKGIDGDYKARENLLYASFLAGKAFNTKMVGNVHSLSHGLSAKYHLSHGRTNAIILPHVLELYIFDKKTKKKMEFLARKFNLNDKDNSKNDALNFLNYIKTFIYSHNITTTIEEIKYEDIPFLVNHAFKEAFHLYPTPLVFSKNMLFSMYINLKNDKNIN